MEELRAVNSLEATAAYLGVTTNVLANMARRGKIGSLKIGRTVTFPKQVIDQYSQDHRRPAAPPSPWGRPDHGRNSRNASGGNPRGNEGTEIGRADGT